jgi:pimeloyl-ACP methyl ester carboxylesterase
MLPSEPNLELRSRVPTRANGNGKKPPLLFVHGGFSDSWFWDAYFLPWFADKGYPAHAVSLRGHGNSGGRDTLFVAGLDDFVADVVDTAEGLPAPPVLIGHSMGAAVIERLMGTQRVRAAALFCPIPPVGLLAMAARLASERPDYLFQLAQFDPMRLTTHVQETLRPYYFSDRVAPAILREAAVHFCAESPRALLDLSLRLHWQLPDRATAPLLVLGVDGDRISAADDVRATAQHHGTEAVILPGLTHMLMLEPDWERPAKELLRWLGTL